MTITVYAASSASAPEEFLRAAQALGAESAQRGITLVNGAGRTGLMGAMTDAALAAGGRVVGVIPQFMIDAHWQHPGLSETIVTPDMHTRKERMAALSDAVIALPGGVGTLEELLEIITWKQLGLYRHPVVLLNVADYYSPLLAQFERASERNLLRREFHSLWRIATSAAEALDLCASTPEWNASLKKLH